MSIADVSAQESILSTSEPTWNGWCDMTRDEAIGEAVGETFAALSNEQSIAAFHRALRERGYAVAPVEPTREMRRAGMGPWASGDREEISRATYRAMLEAVR